MNKSVSTGRTKALIVQVALKQQVTELVLKGFHLSHEAPKIQGWPSLQALCDRRACMDSVSLRLTLQLQLSQVSLTSLEAHASILNNNLSQLLEQTRYEDTFCSPAISLSSNSLYKSFYGRIVCLKTLL